MLQIIEQAKKNLSNNAIKSGGVVYTYHQLIQETEKLTVQLLGSDKDLSEARVAFMVNPGFHYVKTMWAIWQSGGVAVPLCLTHPLPSLEYVLDDTQASIIIISKEYEQVLAPYLNQSKARLIILDELSISASDIKINDAILPNIDKARNAMILYTSGTTNKPKGVVTTHINIEAQISTLVRAWEWNAQDSTICVLPLHHVHGIINVIGCSMWAGASCTFIPQFSASQIFDLMEQGALNVFMAVPTIYFKLIAYYETLETQKQQVITKAMNTFRLMVCGSAALPVSVMEKWESISGQRLLERYGMTELGMAISNPYHGARRAGYVGMALPGVTIKLVDETYQEVGMDTPGEIVVKGDNVFKEYWQRVEATRETFTTDGWFKTGDIAIQEQGYYRIMGRNSVDIIKSGGYKISALEIEEVLREHELVEDCAVVGINDDEWGELIVSAIVLNKELAASFNETELSAWLVQKMASYKKPRKYLVLDELPRNAMGKVVKNEVKKLFE